MFCQLEGKDCPVRESVFQRLDKRQKAADQDVSQKTPCDDCSDQQFAAAKDHDYTCPPSPEVGRENSTGGGHHSLIRTDKGEAAACC
ncbi:hypothetical protein FQA47_019725 [Oryzias melastigma]|uniref:Uncharacterized protein n=1 Tax=Oryzias melastigma TaxID=30732 RepID=A0A834FML5_ORYME|nr:hypothetical protein FQA47_019725 [Oryzias melastigma]